MNLIRHPGKYALVLCLLRIATGMPLSAQQPHTPPHPTAVEPKAGVTTPGSKVMVYGSGFSPDTVVYFGGLEVRETKFISPSKIEVVTPYLRPASYRLQVKSGETTVRSDVAFTALPAPIDAEIDRAIAITGQGQSATAIAILMNIAKTDRDYQVRAFAHYQLAQVYFAQGDWWHWAGEASGPYDDAERSGGAVQTSWRYRLLYARSVYLLPIESDPKTALQLADWMVTYDATQDPEPRFFRGLLNARCGNLIKAKTDSDFILRLEPDNPSYRALAAYIAVLSGDNTQLQSFNGEPISDTRALSLLGEAAYLSGDFVGAQLWWAQEAKIYPLGGSLAYWAGKKHLARGHRRVAEALLAECVAIAANSKEAKEAKDLLASAKGPGS